MKLWVSRSLILTVICAVLMQLVHAGELDVNIAVLSDPEERLSSYYDLGSSATLVCHVQNDTTGPVSYHWQSTSSDFFAYNSSAMFNRKRLLSAADAGVHTCTVTDTKGNTGQAILPMMFSGITMYVTKSYGNEESVLTNNSAILYYPSSCSNCYIEFYCFSNSTQSGVGDVVFPDGSVQTHNQVERLPFSTLRVRLSNPVMGVFTCRLPDSNGKILENSISLYRSVIDKPQIHTMSSGYIELAMDTEIPDMARVECYTFGYPPTTVTWKKDGVEIDTLQSSTYESLQVVVNRTTYQYISILRLRQILDIMGNHTYTCEVGNSAGTSSFSINIDIPVTPKSRVEVAPESLSGHEGEVVTLSCTGSIAPMKATAQLVSYITTEWVGPTGVSLTHENDIILSHPIQTDSGVVHTLTINGTMYHHSGLYSCIVTLNDSLRHVSNQYISIKKNITVYDSEDAVYETNHTSGSMVCVWEKEPLSEMEWLFVGSNRITPLTATNETWDMVTLKCFVQGPTILRQLTNLLIVHAVVIENITIDVSPTSAIAGVGFKMMCRINSDGPVTLTWIGPDENTISPTPHITLETTEDGLSLVFPTVKTSQGGVYTCRADVGGSSSPQSKEADYLLIVTIPIPSLSISSSPTSVYPSQRLTLNCGLRFPPEVDTPVNVNIQWSGPTSIDTNSRATVTGNLSKNSTLVIDSVSFTDDGLYNCTASIKPTEFAEIRAPVIVNGINIDISLNVSISVDYIPPSDFSLPSPPYYRPASSVTLTCVAPPDAVQPLTYRWSSTCSSCSVTGSSSRQITINILKSTDAGVHTCTVTDAQRHTGSSQTPMKLIGAGIYVADRTPRALSNNTALYHSCTSCRLTIYCYSNSTSRINTAVITTPHQGDVFSYSSYRDPISIARVSPSGIRLLYQNNYYTRTSGTYICRIPDSEGNQVHLSFGLHFTSASPPYIYSGTYTYSTTTASIVRLECQSYNSIPKVTWLRNGDEVDVDNDKYEVVDMVNTRGSLSRSYFRSILIVRSLLRGLGTQNYTCLFENTFGNSSRNIQFQRPGLYIDASLRQPVYGISLNLSCRNIQLRDLDDESVKIEWIGPEGINLTGKNNITVRRQEANMFNFFNIITFDYVRSSMNGVYTCKLTAEHKNETYTETATYVLNITGSMRITGNNIPLLVGSGRSIRCSWFERDYVHLAWYIEGLYSVPLVYTDTNSSLTLYIDPSTTGLNGTTFVCRATDSLQNVAQQTTTINVKDISVEISLDYEAPPDFDLPAPYYRPASDLTLLCIPRGTSSSVSYRWNSTHSRSPTNQNRNRVVTISTLDAYDSGRHTCTITDSDGSSVSTSIDISLYGIGVSLHDGYNSFAIANNSALYGYRWELVTFYCYSNSTEDSGTTLLPNGHHVYIGHSNGAYVSQQTPSGVSLQPKQYRNSPMLTGIYTFKMRHRFGIGQLRELSFGLYTTPISVPRIRSIDFLDFTSNDNVSWFGMVVCSSDGFAPSQVSWRQNSDLILKNNTSFMQSIEVVSRRSSSYDTKLIIMDLNGMIGNFIYTCSLGNDAGTASSNIVVSSNVDSTMLSLIVEKEPDYLSDFSLSCKATVPRRLTSLLPYMTLMWISSLDENITDENLILDEVSLSSNLSLPAIDETYNGVYTCQLVINLPTAVITKDVDYTINVKAVNISMEHYPLIVGVENVVTCILHERETRQFRMELILTNTNQTIATAIDTRTLTHRLVLDISINGSEVVCRASDGNLIVFENSLTLHLTELVHDVRIEMESAVAVAGDRFTLTCIATADFPTTLSWRQPNGTRGNVSSMTIDGNTYSLSVTFDSLRMSNGGLFECTSQIMSINSTSSDNISLSVEAPQPIVTLSKTGEIVAHRSNQTLICDVLIVEEVDVPVAVELEWTVPNLNSTFSVSNSSSSSTFFYITDLNITNFTLRDSGEYSCTATVTPIHNTEGISNNTVSSTESVSLTLDLDVTIAVDYSPPPDFFLPSPPYYRPASSVTLTCRVTSSDIVEVVTYEWVSTNSESFVASARGQTITQSILTGFDAGQHRCIARDELGNTGTDEIEMKIYGAGIYISNSADYSSSPVANNTGVRYNSYFTFYCVSNYTTTHFAPSVVHYQSRVFPNTSDSYISVSEHDSGLYVRHRRRSFRDGIYTCSISDSNGNIVELSVGFYRNEIRVPDISNVIYALHVNDLSTDVLATVSCYTRYQPPTSIVWRRNDIDVPIDGSKYELQQRLSSYYSSEYQNILIIRDIAGMEDGSQQYTCEVTNSAGSNSRSTYVLNNGGYHIYLSASISPDPSATYGYARGKNFSLDCSVELNFSRPLQKLRLLQNTRVEWLDKDGPLQEDKNLRITQSLQEDGNVQSTLHFSPLRPWNARLYTCTATLDVPTLSVPAQSDHYRIIIGTAYFQLSFYAMPCTSQDDPVYNELEHAIIQTLTNFIEKQCKCGFASPLFGQIDQGEFLCGGHNDETIYRARVIGGSDTLSADKIMRIIENWKENDGTFLYGSGRKKRVWVTSHCPLKISSFTAEIC